MPEPVLALFTLRKIFPLLFNPQFEIWEQRELCSGHFIEGEASVEVLAQAPLRKVQPGLANGQPWSFGKR